MRVLRLQDRDPDLGPEIAAVLDSIYLCASAQGREGLMQTVTVEIIDARNGGMETRQFHIWKASELNTETRRLLAHAGAIRVNRHDWEDAAFAIIEKQAAMAVGIRYGQAFLCKRIYV